MGSLNESSDLKHINLQLGWPTPSLFPAQCLATAAQHVLLDKETSAQALVYGPDPGHQDLRKATASWLGRLYNLDINALPTADRIFITNGASAGISYLLSLFTDSTYTRMIWMVEPTYFLACPVFEQAGFEGRLRGVPEDDQGINLNYLRSEISQADKEHSTARASGCPRIRNESQRKYRHIIYVVPTFSNPSGKCMPTSRRIELLKIAREYDALVISDDVYDALNWSAEGPRYGENRPLQAPPPRLVDLDRQLPGYLDWGNAVSNGSFSKIVAPGVRVGWIEASPKITHELCKLGPVVSGGCQAHLSSMMISDLIQTGQLEKHISNVLIPTYSRRYRSMVRSIQAHLMPLGATIVGSGKSSDFNESAALAGGFFLYLNFPCSSETVERLRQVSLKKFNLKVAIGSLMVVKGDEGSSERAAAGFARGVRLCWAWHEEEEINEGIQRLAAAYSMVTRSSIDSI